MQYWKKLKTEKSQENNFWSMEDKKIWLCNAVHKQNTTEKLTNGCIFSFPKNGDFRITKNYKGITLTVIVAKVYNTLLLDCIQLEI